jgi:hypothetical protein
MVCEDSPVHGEQHEHEGDRYHHGAHVHQYAASAEDFRDKLAVARAPIVGYALPLAAERMPLKVRKTYPFETGAPGAFRVMVGASSGTCAERYAGSPGPVTRPGCRDGAAAHPAHGPA